MTTTPKLTVEEEKDFDETMVEDWLDADYHSNRLPLKFDFADMQLIGELLNPNIKAYSAKLAEKRVQEERENILHILCDDGTADQLLVKAVRKLQTLNK